MNLSLPEHYAQMWQAASDRIRRGDIEPDPLLDAPDDTRYGISLLARPDEQTAAAISAFLQECRVLEPAQYYYPHSDLHLTVLSIISCYAGFRLEQVEQEAYRQCVAQALQGIPPFTLTFSGISASSSTVVLQGFPGDDTLEKLRNRLRTNFHQSGLEHSIDSRYRIVTAHSTVVRFREKLQRPARFADFLAEQRQRNFGGFRINSLELLGNDWYQRKEKTVLLKKYALEAVV
jgi:2'-5' RNA ligase